MSESKKEYLFEELEEGHCLCCGKDMTYGRSGRKFCSQQCRNTYHNRSKSHLQQAKMKIDGILERNYRILNDLVKMEVSQIPLEMALSMGFNPSFSTSFMRQRTVTVASCYDIAYRISENRIFNIHRLTLSLRQIKK